MSDYPYETKFLSPLPANPVSVMCDKITSIKSLSDPMDILIGIYEGINVYNNYTGNVPCFDIDSDTPSDINMDAWVYQVFTGLHSFFKKYHLGLIFGFRLQIYAYF